MWSCFSSRYRTSSRLASACVAKGERAEPLNFRAGCIGIDQHLSRRDARILRFHLSIGGDLCFRENSPGAFPIDFRRGSATVPASSGAATCETSEEIGGRRESDELKWRSNEPNQPDSRQTSLPLALPLLLAGSLSLSGFLPVPSPSFAVLSLRNPHNSRGTFFHATVRRSLPARWSRAEHARPETERRAEQRNHPYTRERRDFLSLPVIPRETSNERRFFTRSS